MNSSSFQSTTVSASAPEIHRAALKARYRWTMFAFSLCAFAVSLFLAWSTIKVGSVLGCDHEGLFDCGHVLQTRWSKFFGIPVSVPAAALHLTLLSLLVASAFQLPLRLRRGADFGIFLCAMCAGAAALWFVGLQFLAIGKLCKYCLMAHSAGLAACLIAMIGCGFRFKNFAKPAVMALALTAILALGQAFGPVPETAVIESHEIAESDLDDFETFDVDFGDLESLDAPDELVADEAVADERLPRPEGLVATSYETESTEASVVSNTPTPTPTPEEGNESSAAPVPSPTPLPQQSSAENERPVKQQPREIAYPGARTKLKVAHWPMVGSSSAPVVVVELFDYTCSHCREMNRHMRVARQRFGDQLAFVLLPVPLNSNCNQTVTQTSPQHADSCEISNLALSVWRVDKSAFPQFHDWLCEPAGGRTAAEARMFAEQLVDSEALRQELSGPIIGKFLAGHVMIYQRAGKGILPKIFSEKITVSGKMSSAEALCDTIRNNHGILPH